MTYKIRYVKIQVVFSQPCKHCNTTRFDCQISAPSEHESPKGVNAPARPPVHVDLSRPELIKPHKCGKGQGTDRSRREIGMFQANWARLLVKITIRVSEV